MKLIRSMVLIVSALVAAAPTSSQKTPEELQLPELHKIMHVTLSPSYSCRSEEEFRKGYSQTALFLSAYSKTRSIPELLFNGACKSPDNFDVNMAGDDLSVITDYGDVPLADLTPQQVFSPKRTTDSVANFVHTCEARLGHTYGLLINKRETRGFFYFRVVRHVPNQSVELEYVVMDYQILRVEAQSPGFNWDEKSSY